MTNRTTTVAPAPFLVDDTSLSSAYARLLLRVVESPGIEISPLVVSISGFNDNGTIQEDETFRKSVDDLLEKKERTSVENVAFTIFPQKYWLIAQRERSALFDLYTQAFPRMKEYNKPLNGRGLYFERMTNYGRGPCEGNQLEWILSQNARRDGVRRSMNQATTFDPERDHIASAQLGFPCLQHVTFEPTSAGLVVNAFYATQQIFDKAYGNYLGLAHLGAFMAHEMKIGMARLNVTVGIAKLDRITKSDADLADVVTAAKKLVDEAETPQNTSS